ncbi:hypothetical protein ONZ45_g2822 [Pleurotus djamor]|nr:hypothetical protein ONZ45_g2822 [Pleurotus djamor]
MPAERAGYTVTMFLVDLSPSMGNTRTIELPPGPDGVQHASEITNLEYALQFVKLKIQDMVYNGRKTDQCGVITFGSEETNNIVHDKMKDGYENVSEFIPIAQPGIGTLAKLDTLEPSSVPGDAIDALVVAIETQHKYLGSKKTWTRKIVLVTDGESPLEVEDWEAIVQKMDALDVSLTVVGVDFDDEELPFYEENKSDIKKGNEKFFTELTASMHTGIIGTCALALRETTKPDIKQTKSALMATVLRLGDVDTRPEEAIELSVKASKATATARAKSWKKFAMRPLDEEDETRMDIENRKAVFSELKMRSEYFMAPPNKDEDGDVKREEETQAEEEAKKNLETVDKEELIRGYKYGSTYAPCPDGQFPKLPTKKGISICGFFKEKNFRRELSMGEIQYIWADPGQPQQQVALSSIVQAMLEKGYMAIARWVSRDGMDPKMGVLKPVMFEQVDCFLWAPMPFADDVRKYNFASLENLFSKKGERIEKHPYIPTEEQQTAMDNFVDAMDLMEAGDKNEEGGRDPWFDTRLSYNPSLHRIKQAMFHCAVVNDVVSNPIPPPHPDLLKYMNPPKKLLKHAQSEIDACKSLFKVRLVPKKVVKERKDGHVQARYDDDEMLLLDAKQPPTNSKSQMRATVTPSQSPSRPRVKVESPQGDVKGKGKASVPPDSETEDDSDEELLLDKVKPKTEPKPHSPPPRNHPLPTPARSISPEPNPERAEGRIIGAAFPLKDFKQSLKDGESVEKAVEDLGIVIDEIVGRPFAMRRKAELLECMETMRETCLKENQIDEWNTFIKDLKETCTSTPGNPAFWSEVQQVGRSIGLITKTEAKKHDGESSVSEIAARKFLA